MAERAVFQTGRQVGNHREAPVLDAGLPHDNSLTGGRHSNDVACVGEKLDFMRRLISGTVAIDIDSTWSYGMARLSARLEKGLIDGPGERLAEIGVLYRVRKESEVSCARISEVLARGQRSGGPVSLEGAHGGAGKTVLDPQLLQTLSRSSVIDLVRWNLVAGGVSLENQEPDSNLIDDPAPQGSELRQYTERTAWLSRQNVANASSAYQGDVRVHSLIMGDLGRKS